MHAISERRFLLAGSTKTISDRRVFWTFWGASLTSGVGTAATQVALPLTAVLVLDASPWQVGVLGAASYAAWLLIGLPAGPIATMFPLRSVQVVSDLLRAFAMASIPIAWLLDRLSLAHLVIAALTISFADVVFETANSSFLPRIVVPAELLRRNSTMSATIATTNFAGQSGAGLVAQLLGPVVTLAADAVTYVGSAFLLWSLPNVETARDKREVRFFSTIRTGIAWVRSEPVVHRAMWASAIMNFAAGAHVALSVIYLTRTLETPPALLGLLLAFDGVAAVLAASLSPRLCRAFGVSRAVRTGALLVPFGALLMPLGREEMGWATFAIGTFILGSGVVLITTSTRTYRQVVVPAEMLPPVSATVRFVAWGVIPLGSLLGGGLASAISTRSTLLLFGVVCVAVPLIINRRVTASLEEVVQT